MPGHLKSIMLIVAAAAVFAFCAALFALPDRAPEQSANKSVERHDERLHGVHVITPEGPPRIDTGLALPLYGTLTIGCATCHATRETGISTNSAEEIQDFHLGMTYEHGGMSCVTCHNGDDDHESLRLADGTQVEYEDVMTLCGQCHGPQFRDYKNGSHGGMVGYWDLTRGGRTRNNCLNCHDPHAPAFQSMMPAPPPIDRFVTAETHHEVLHGDDHHE